MSAQLIRPVRSLALVPFLALLVLLASSGPVRAAQGDFGQPVPDVSVYDYTGLLTDSEREMLEQRADAIERTGTPVVVYLQAKEADFDETLQDGRELMEAWDVQSAPNARDGVVIFLNLDPDDLRHGQLALVAGEAHFDGGNLPQYELDRITSEMRSILGEERTAEGIARGLEMIEQDLVAGPPPPPEPSRAERIATDLSEGPFSPANIISVLVAAAVGFFTWARWQDRPTSNAPVSPTTTPPGDLIPAAAGALVDSRVNDLEIEATILDLARRDALLFEPEGNNKVQIRLLDPSVVQNEFERLVWESLAKEATDDGVVENDRLSKVRSHWDPAKDALRRGLEHRGWFDPEIERLRMPLYIVGAVALVLAVAALIILAIAEQPWILVGVASLAIVGLLALGAGYDYPATTQEGERQAAPWRGYLEGLKAAGKDPNADLDLDEAMPYAVAMNARDALDKQLKTASEEGYVPLWLGGTLAADTWSNVGFYAYFAAFHTTVTPTVGTGAGGAATGSGGSGGSF